MSKGISGCANAPFPTAGACAWMIHCGGFWRTPQMARVGSTTVGESLLIMYGIVAMQRRRSRYNASSVRAMKLKKFVGVEDKLW